MISDIIMYTLFALSLTALAAVVLIALWGGWDRSAKGKDVAPSDALLFEPDEEPEPDPVLEALLREEEEIERSQA